MSKRQERQSFTPDDKTFQQKLARRHTWSKTWQVIFLIATLIGLVALVALFVDVLDDSFGTVAVSSRVAPETLSDRPLSELSAEELAAILGQYAPRRLRVIVRDELSVVDAAVFTQLPVREALAGATLPPGTEERTISELSDEQVIAILGANLPQDTLLEYVVSDVVGLDIFKTWPLSQTLFDYPSIEAEFQRLVAEQDVENARLEFRSWLTWDFVRDRQSSFPEIAGVRTAIMGTLWIMLLTMALAFPVGVGAAIYLEEYANRDNWLERIIETNIRNLAGVPSIIYGLLGLAIFVRALEPFTSGAAFGVTGSNGRTIISASFTMALLILPVIIIAAQEAIRAVPQSIREASYGLGATKWQTIWRQVLPAAMPGILTGTILSLSRAIGETAPLIVIGASAVIFVDPGGPFSKFTALPIQIWQWTARPQDEFRSIAAAAIVVLLTLLLLLNSTAIILRQRLSRRYHY